MIKDKFLLMGIVALFIGIDWIVGILPHPKGSKYYCGGEDGCVKMGIIFIILGIFLLGYRFYKNRINS